MKHQSIRKAASITLAATFATTLAMGGSISFARADQGAVRAACAEDYKALCSTVQPGGGRIIACLKENAGKLSAGCQKALETAKAPQ